jgi:exonuclease VII small subunit
MKDKDTKPSIKQQLDDLQSIVTWFDSQENVDVEKGLAEVKRAANLIKSLKLSLKDVENEFEEIKKDLDKD